ncbi:SHOCT domain-containing protein [Sulfurimonas sp. C5]|uniref:SHOCT domain-containing protein n=1 Tax=Sulfurimonas sp. C5 TaxID=3036947 RepID=UPI0024582E78|nr:SHOCT domain-containing protein [Sulfurimonas sp. C5]MDH4944587.1 SHOCT domain-containing protein [Sulfurimonas sp. C5]
MNKYLYGLTMILLSSTASFAFSFGSIVDNITTNVTNSVSNSISEKASEKADESIDGLFNPSEEEVKTSTKEIAQSSQPTNKVAQLKELIQMKKEGYITQEEFNQQKAILMAK